MNPDIELTITEFLANQPQWIGPHSGLVTRVESGKGLLGVFLNVAPYCVNVVQADFLALVSLRYFVRGGNVGDLIAVLGAEGAE